MNAVYIAGGYRHVYNSELTQCENEEIAYVLAEREKLRCLAYRTLLQRLTGAGKTVDEFLGL